MPYKHCDVCVMSNIVMSNIAHPAQCLYGVSQEGPNEGGLHVTFSVCLVVVMLKKHTVPHQNGQQQPLPSYVQSAFHLL